VSSRFLSITNSSEYFQKVFSEDNYIYGLTADQ